MSDVTMPPEAASMPDPGNELISRVVGGADRAWFYWTGRESVHDLERILGTAGRTLDSFESILDFGCGCGRMLLWMEELNRTCALHGADIDADAIRWCAEHVPYAEVKVNDADPPLGYPDGEFELVYGHSVLTHLDEQRQDAWLSELQRVTSPGGFLVLSTHGEVALCDDRWRIRERLGDEGIVFIDDVYGPEYPAPVWYQRTFHARRYVLDHWGRWFEIRAYVPGGALGVQDLVLLQRRAGDDAPGRLA
jgi:SAM-dependent methyltransferase